MHCNPTAAGFCRCRNLQAMLISSAPVVTAALGMTIVIIAGGIDLSAGTAVALCATVMAWVLNEGGPIELALILCVLTGCVAGGVNGILISTLKVAPFIVTLGTMTAYLGIAKLVADETTVRPPLESVPSWMNGLAMPGPDPAWLLVAPGVWIMLLMAVVVSLVLRYTVFGRYVFALGSNEQTARLCGINVPALKVAVYTLAGLFVGLAGIYQFAKLKVGNPISGRRVGTQGHRRRCDRRRQPERRPWHRPGHAHRRTAHANDRQWLHATRFDESRCRTSSSA